MPFHRFDDPTYDLQGGSFPGSILGVSYDRANVTDGGTGTSGSALVDAAKASGVNAGTYFVAFGEDALSAHVNRGLRALCDNTDELDNVVSGSMPRTTLRSGTASGSVQDILLSGDFYVGKTTESRAVSEMYEVTSSDGTALYTGGTRIVPTLIHDGALADVSNSTADGFYSSPTLRVSPAIPNGVSYTVRAGIRSSYSKLQKNEPGDAWLKGQITLHDQVAQSLAKYTHGLDDVYRKNTSAPSGWDPANPDTDTPGAGATLTRDGPAIHIIAQDGNWDGTTRHPDPFRAHMRLSTNSARSSGINGARSGDMGFLALAYPRHDSSDTAEYQYEGQTVSGFTSLCPRDVRGSTHNSATSYTYWPADAGATLNPGGAASASVEIDSPYYFREAGGKTAIRYKADCVLITFSDGTQELFQILSLSSDTRATLLTMGSTTPSFSADEAVTITWYSGYVGIAGSKASNPDWGALSVYMPARLSDSTYLSALAVDPPAFVAASPMYDGAADYQAGSVTEVALTSFWWGQAMEDGSVERSNGKLLGDGSIKLEKGLVNGARRETNLQLKSSTTTARTYYYNPTGRSALHNGSSQWAHEESGSMFTIQYHGTGAVTYTIDVDAAYTLQDGDRITVMVNVADTGNVAITWGSEFIFSGADGTIPTNDGPVMYKYEGVVCSWVDSAGVDQGKRFFMTRTDYYTLT
jgi:hypothetical protein